MTIQPSELDSNSFQNQSQLRAAPNLISDYMRDAFPKRSKSLRFVFLSFLESDDGTLNLQICFI